MLPNLSVALREVRKFVHNNRAALGSNIRGLNRVSKTLVKRRDSITAQLAMLRDVVAGFSDEDSEGSDDTGNAGAGSGDVSDADGAGPAGQQEQG